MNGAYFIILVTVLELSAAVAYSCVSDWRRAVFWACASIMNVVVTW